jgi:hypothetical protein
LIQAIGTDNVQIGGWTLDDNCLYYNETIGAANSFWLSPTGIQSAAKIGGSEKDLSWLIAICGTT